MICSSELTEENSQNTDLRLYCTMLLGWDLRICVFTVSFRCAIKVENDWKIRLLETLISDTFSGKDEELSYVQLWKITYLFTEDSYLERTLSFLLRKYVSKSENGVHMKKMKELENMPKYMTINTTI
jgi:hypothetical protein